MLRSGVTPHTHAGLTTTTKRDTRARSTRAEYPRQALEIEPRSAPVRAAVRVCPRSLQTTCRGARQPAPRCRSSRRGAAHLERRHPTAVHRGGLTNRPMDGSGSASTTFPEERYVIAGWLAPIREP